MKRQTAKWVHKAERDWEVAHKLAGEGPPPRDIVCFHCQQAAEKYLKALLQESGHIERPANDQTTPDDTMTAVTLWPPLTTVHQPVRELGAEALRLLAAQISAPAKQTSSAGARLLDYKMIHRQSVAPPAAA